MSARVLAIDTQPRCPLCAHALDRVRAFKDGGVIEEPCIAAIGMQIVRRARPASFWACAFCEWCGEEVSR